MASTLKIRDPMIVEEDGVTNVTFIFPLDPEPGKCVHTQKHVLIDNSEIFEHQFKSLLNEETEEYDWKPIPIKDISFDNFIMMLDYIFFGLNEILADLCEENCIELLYASQKYRIHKLTYDIILFLKKVIVIGNVVSYYRSVEKYKIKMLTDHIVEVCVKEPLTVIKELSINDIDLMLLKKILKSPKLKCSEYQLYHAIWVLFKNKHKVDKYTDEQFRSDVGKLKYLIRFPLMTVSQLLDIAAWKPCLLTLQELIDFQQWADSKIEPKFFSNTIQFYSVTKRGE